MSEVLSPQTYSRAQETRKRIVKAAVSIGVGILGLSLGTREYADHHEEITPIEISSGSKLLNSPHKPNAVVILMPTKTAEDYSCGMRERPLTPDFHNEKTLIAQMGGNTIVQCINSAEVPILQR